MPYSEYLPALMPPPLKGPWALKFFAAVGGRMDVIDQRYRDAVLARLPGFAPSDGLDVIGKDRTMPRGAGESDANFAARLQNAWNVWGGDHTPFTGVGGGAGTPLSLLRELLAAGFPAGPSGATIVTQTGRYWQLDVLGNLVMGALQTCINKLDLSGAINARPGWTFDGRDDFWSVFGIVFPTAATIDGGSLNAIVNRWMPSRLYVGAWVIQAGRLLGWPRTARTLATEPVLGGNSITFIPSSRGDHLRIGYQP